MTGAIEAVDLESRTTLDDHLSLRVWLRLLSCANLIEARTRVRLRDEFATTLGRFDLMAQLERSPAGLQMNELGRRLMVTGGNVTRLTDQLESEGLVMREPAPKDRRALRVRLTNLGRRTFGAMARRHEEWIVETFGALTRRERLLLYGVLAKLKANAARPERSAR
jgi:DNA-binding MarR family transcriptional regulator